MAQAQAALGLPELAAQLVEEPEGAAAPLVAAARAALQEMDAAIQEITALPRARPPEPGVLPSADAGAVGSFLPSRLRASVAAAATERPSADLVAEPRARQQCPICFETRADVAESGRLGRAELLAKRHHMASTVRRRPSGVDRTASTVRRRPSGVDRPASHWL